MRGPKPKPAAVKAQTSAVRSRREPKAAAAAPAPTPAAIPTLEPPAWLEGEGLEIWRTSAPTLVAARLLSVADGKAFARYCRNFARWLKLQRELDAEGETYESESDHGKLKRLHPAALFALRLERELVATEDRFGLNPAERQRILAARAQSGGIGDLFDPPPAPGDKSAASPPDPAAKPPPAAERGETPRGPIGLLN